MEILSDATFKGNVSINGGNFSITRSGESSPIIQTNKKYEPDGGYGGYYALYVDGSEFVKDLLNVGGNAHIGGCLDVNCISSSRLSTNSLCLNNTTITTWSGLNSILSFAKLKTFTSPSIPANCTAFEFTGTAISDSNKTHVIQVQNTSTGKSVIAETWMTTNKKPAMSFAGCTSTIAAGTYTAMVV